tara:strand:+ start:367 stop:1002 length:636 start_codon:yes stop_codon:yes gene_type:complete
MKKILGILAIIGLIVVLIWGIKLFDPIPKQPTVWDKEAITFNFSEFPFQDLGIPLDSVYEWDMCKCRETKEVCDCFFNDEGLNKKLPYPLQLAENDISEGLYDTITIKATMYHAVIGQCDDSPDVTADQTKIPNVDSCSHLNWVAVSQDLLWFNDGPIHYGDTVYIIAGHKTGFYIVRDAMNKRWKRKVDFLESTGVESYRYNKAELIINS